MRGQTACRALTGARCACWAHRRVPNLNISPNPALPHTTPPAHRCTDANHRVDACRLQHPLIGVGVEPLVQAQHPPPAPRLAAQLSHSLDRCGIQPQPSCFPQRVQNLDGRTEQWVGGGGPFAGADAEAQRAPARGHALGEHALVPLDGQAAALRAVSLTCISRQVASACRRARAGGGAVWVTGADCCLQLAHGMAMDGCSWRGGVVRPCASWHHNLSVPPPSTQA